MNAAPSESKRVGRRVVLRVALGAGLAGAALASGPLGATHARADGREAAYDALLETAAALKAIEPTDADRRQLMRATAVKLARRLKHFLVTETEIRSEDKVGAPPGAERPAMGDAARESRPPGPERVPLDRVPTPWFARYGTEARRALDTLIKALDRDDVQTAHLMLQAERVGDHLRALARPPAPRG